MTKKTTPSKSPAATAAQSIIETIEAEVRDLSDEDYLEALDEVESWCSTSTAAKREEQEREQK